jgi:hypothetical protein
MGLLGIALLIFGLSACKKITIGANSANLSSCHESLDHPCTPGVPRGPTLSTDLATPDMATPDLATPDLATPDLATPDLATPDLATPDLTSPSPVDMASPPPDLTSQQGDMMSPRVDMTGSPPTCQSNGLRTWWPPDYPLNTPPCGGNCPQKCDIGQGCANDSECGTAPNGEQLVCQPDIVNGVPTTLLYCSRRR